MGAERIIFSQGCPGASWRLLAPPGAPLARSQIIISSPTPQEGDQGVGAERIIFSQGCPDASWPLPVRLVGPVGLVRPVGLDSLAPLPPTGRTGRTSQAGWTRFSGPPPPDLLSNLNFMGVLGGYGSMVPQWGRDQADWWRCRQPRYGPRIANATPRQ